MATYEPGNDSRGTCPYCDRRCRVYVPRGGDGSARVVAHHYAPVRLHLGARVRCDGVKAICVEDRRRPRAFG